MTRRVVAITNPRSASGRTGKRWPAIRADLAARGLAVDVRMTAGPGDATALTRRAIAEGYDLIVAVGGDGTINEVVNGFFPSNGGAATPASDAPALGVIPSGSGGDFRRSLGVPCEIAAAVDVIASGTARPCDVGRLTSAAGGEARHFINIADCGVGGEVAARVNASRGKRIGGTPAFFFHSMSVLMSYRARAVEIELDGELLERTVQNVVVANGRAFGGGMQVAPHACLDDGLFDIVIINAASRLRTARDMPLVYRGRHIGRDGVELRRATTVSVRHAAGEEPLLFEAEGEDFGATGAVLTCLPNAIRVYAGAGAAFAKPWLAR